MSRQQLSLEVMQALCTGWLGDPAQRKILDSHPEFKVVVPRVEHAKQSLFATDVSKDARLKKLTVRSAELDGVHDALIRLLLAIFGVIEMLSPDNASYTELREWMFPEGASHTGDTYETEVGHALRIAQELPAHKKALASIKVDGTTLLSVVEKYLQAAADLGANEQLRQQENQPTNIREARREFLAVANLIISSAKVVKLSASDRKTLLGPLDTAAAKAGKKAVEATPAPTNTESDALALGKSADGQEPETKA